MITALSLLVCLGMAAGGIYFFVRAGQIERRIAQLGALGSQGKDDE